MMVKVWDAEVGRELLTLEEHRDFSTTVAFSPDGKRLATSCDRSGAVWVWDALDWTRPIEEAERQVETEQRARLQPR
jgi:WD40 repeat protein